MCCALASATAACVPPDPPTTGAASVRLGVSVAPLPTDLAAASAPTPVAQLPLLAAVFRDSFERDALGSDYEATGDVWRIEAGMLCAREARNHPLWLRHRLPTNARIEFVAMSRSTDGDLKVEVWGDGRSSASGDTYSDATGYVAIFGGWQNRWHVLARLDEHGEDRQGLRVDPTAGELPSQPVLPHRRYRLAVERTDGRSVRFSVDGTEVACLVDPAPLAGPGHEHFAFNDWMTEVCFDDLVITPL